MRILVLFLLATALVTGQKAKAPQDAATFLALLAADLSAEDGGQFVKKLSPKWEGYRELVPQIDALTKIADLQSSLEITELKTEGDTATATLDWYLEIRPHSSQTDDQRFTAIRRRELVRCWLERDKKSWRVVRLEPLSFFSVPELK
ncbi:MAG: hypothetical protein K2Q23_18920 [Bryobacteraceae bacterium]|nr:hypothetical protein [Bryobacteraceae bacterium]